MHAANLISSALECSDRFRPDPLPEKPAYGICCITGDYGPTISRSALLSDTFLDGETLARPGSDRISVHVWRAFTAQEDRGKKRGYFPERQSSWLVTCASWQPLDRIGVRAAVLGHPPITPWAGYVTTSYKKHGALRAPVNPGGSGGVWLFESRRVDCRDRDHVRVTWDRLEEARRRGVPRPVIEQLDAGSALIQKLGLAWWMDFSAWARPQLHSPLYEFCTYLLPSAEEIKKDEPRPAIQKGESASLFNGH